MVLQAIASFQSTPSVWRETQIADKLRDVCRISIHSLRMEGDPVLGKFALSDRHFNPLPPYGGRLGNIPPYGYDRKNFNPLPPYGGRPRANLMLSVLKLFQSTPSVWRETISSCLVSLCKPPFQSTPSVWRETPSASAWRTASKISIHSLRMEGDRREKSSWNWTRNFNPLPPYGGRRTCLTDSPVSFANFNPLPPYGGRQPHCCCRRNRLDTISIHSLRMEGDDFLEQLFYVLGISIHSLRRVMPKKLPKAWHFNPLPPYGGRLAGVLCTGIRIDISIHSLRMEGDIFHRR